MSEVIGDSKMIIYSTVCLLIARKIHVTKLLSCLMDSAIDSATNLVHVTSAGTTTNLVVAVIN